MTQARYHASAITLHWVMALAFFLMLASGLAMVNAPLPQALKFQMFQWHKSLGVLLLLAFFLRLAIRLWKPAPMLPDSMPAYEKKAAKLGHWAFYGWMLLLPLTGWLMVSSSPYGLPTIVFGWFEWPHVPGVAGNTALSEGVKELHEWLAISFMVLIALHISAVVKHAVKDGENLLPRMGVGKVRK